MDPDSELNTTYATPDEIADTLGLPDTESEDTYGVYRFSDMTNPSYRQVQRMILANEDVIDRRLRNTWREHRVRDHVVSISQLWRDINGWRMDYYVEGGDFVQLHRGVLPWDPAKGDRLEFRTINNEWVDATRWADEGSRDEWERPETRDHEFMPAFWFDYEMGKLYVRTNLFQRKRNALRISYRWGSEEPVPAAINRLCCLKTASQVLNMQVFNIKVGTGGDVSGIREGLLRAWQDEMNEIWSSYQRMGSVRPLGGG